MNSSKDKKIKNKKSTSVKVEDPFAFTESPKKPIPKDEEEFKPTSEQKQLPMYAIRAGHEKDVEIGVVTKDKFVDPLNSPIKKTPEFQENQQKLQKKLQKKSTYTEINVTGKNKNDSPRKGETVTPRKRPADLEAKITVEGDFNGKKFQRTGYFFRVKKNQASNNAATQTITSSATPIVKPQNIIDLDNVVQQTFHQLTITAEMLENENKQTIRNQTWKIIAILKLIFIQTSIFA